MLPAVPGELWVALEGLHYAYPAVVFFYFVLTLTATVCTLQTQHLRIRDEHVRRDFILGLLAAITGSYLVEAITVVVRFFVTGLQPEQDHMVSLLASTAVFGAQTMALTDSQFPVWYPYYGTWFIGILAESCFLIVPNIFNPPRTYFEYILIIEQALRLCVFILLPVLYFGLRTDTKSYDNFDAERQSLLGKKLASKPPDSEESTLNGNGYGSTTDAASKDSDAASDAGSEDSWLARERKAKEAIQKRLQQDGSWFTYAKGFAVFLPYLWPIHNKALQFRAVLVGFCLLAGNALNLLVPMSLGQMVDSLTRWGNGNKSENIWIPVFVYALLGFVSGGACIGWIRRWLWMPLEQYSYDALSTASHAHIMSLSSDFHDSKTSSDLTQAISGGQSVFHLVETVLFQIIPMFIDLAVAFGYLWSIFGPYMGLVMASFVVAYLYITTKLYAVRAEKRRDYITIYRKEWTIGQQSLDGWNTASLFNMIPYERQRYANAVSDHMKSKMNYEMSSQFISAAQSLVMTIGKIAALCLGVWQIYNGKNTIGQFTTLIVYWAQLQSPLVFFSTMYRSISHSLMDAERLLELFQTKPTIKDAPSAKTLKLSSGLVTFDNVSFAYDERKPTLKNVNFTVPAGKTVALVGETGGGKSTILKLIDRFYDVKGGKISIDGQDIRDVTLSSLREKIGVVPQDPMLFNDSIMNNIRYARLSASDDEVHEACKAAAVHDKIMSFPDGYNSKVGDRGVKLSGGEKQRVAIARAILKRPEIILLDEATSAVDTETEQIIQEGLSNLCQGRTTFIVAHRLSTIMKSDTILVVMNGEIIEEGSHDNLILAGGKYHDLWTKQIFVKPAPDSNPNDSSIRKKLDKDIINDITDSKSTMSLAKALGKEPEQKKKGGDTNTPVAAPSEYTNEMGYEDEQPFTTKCETKEDVDCQDSALKAKNSREDAHKSSTGHETDRRKGKAPEFVSRKVDLPSRQSSNKTNAKIAAKLQKKQLKEEQKLQERERKVASLSRKSDKKSAKTVDPVKAGGVSVLDGAHSPDISKDSEASEFAEIVSIPNRAPIQVPIHIPAENFKPRRKRYPRRYASRSEPAGKAFDYSHHGRGASESAQKSSGEGKASVSIMAPAQQQLRRVSAPSDPPAGPRKGNVLSRQRRHGFRRLQNRNKGNTTASSVLSSLDFGLPGEEDVSRAY